MREESSLDARTLTTMTTDHEASRTLVKSPPELWAECSDAGSLARHLGEFGEIRITRLEPENVVAWEGEQVSGTVRIEPSGWGTRVTLTAKTELEDLAEVTGEAEEPTVEDEQLPPESPPSPGGLVQRAAWWSRLWARFRDMPVAVEAQQPVGVAEPEPPAPEESAMAGEATGDPTAAVLTAALDSLGQAHHRPFSRG